MSNTKAPQAPMSFRPGGPRGRMGAPTEKAKDSRQTLRRLLRYFDGEKKYVIRLFIAVGLTVVLTVLAPSYLSRAIDRITTRQFDQVPRILGIMLFLYVSSSIIQLLQEYTSAHLSQRIVKHMRTDLFNKTIRLPISYIDQHSHGDLISRMTNDAENISNTISQSLSSLFSGVLTLIGTVAMMLWYSWELTLLSCTTIIFSVLFTRLL